MFSSRSRAPVSASVLLAIVALLACTMLHNYSVFPREDVRIPGRVHFGTWPYTILETEDIGNAVIDEGGTIWGMDIYYIQDAVPPGNLRLAADSVRIYYPGLGITRSLIRDKWRHRADHTQERIILNIGPISIPRGYDSEVQVSLILTARDICADTVVFREPVQLTWRKR